MTRLWRRPVPITVECDDLGNPRCFYFAGRKHTITECMNSWSVDMGWWRFRTCRDYFEVYTTTLYMAEIYRDATTNQWHLERLHA
jgi:hypothetical protein